MKKDILFLSSVTIILLIILFALFFGHKYYEGDIKEQYKPPSLRNIMGTDIHGRDLLARLSYGVRISLIVGFVATVISLVIGVTYGCAAGLGSRFLDNFMMRFVDVLYGLPFIAFVMIIMVMFKDEPADVKLLLMFVVLGCIQWLTIARVVRAEVLKLKKSGLVESAIALGTKRHAILLKHILPNIRGVVITFGTLTVPVVILGESFLSFLGLGIQPPKTSLGLLISEGAYLINKDFDYWWLLIFPSVFLVLILFSLNNIGNALLRRRGL